MLLRIDLGTSGVKTVVLDDAQRLIATAEAALDVSRPQALWCEYTALLPHGEEPITEELA